MLKATRSGMLLLCLLSSYVVAETRYVSDSLMINFRSGPSNEYRITNRLKSSTQLTLIGESQGDFTKVRTPSGKEGWVRKQYLTSTPTAKLRVAALQDQLSLLTEKHGPLADSFTQLQTDNQQLSTELSQLRLDKQQLSEELTQIKEISASAIQLDQEHKQLLEDRQMLRHQIDVLEAKNDSLQIDQRNNGLMIGGIIAILSMILTMIAPRLKRRNTHSEWA